VSSTRTLDFLVRLLKWRKWILLNTAIVAVLAIVISLLLPNEYEAHVSILPPQDDALDLTSLSGGISRALSSFAGGGLSFSGRMSLPMWATPSDLLAGILRSRRVAERVIAEHDLAAVYKGRNFDQTLEEYWEHVRVRVSPDGIVRMRVRDRDPARAAAMASTAVAALDEIQRETRHAGAGQVRAFVAERLEATRNDLAAAEDSLRGFEERYGLLVPEEQARALVETIASVEAERLAAEVERNALAAQMGPSHPEVQRIEARLRSLNEARAALEGRGPEARGAARSTRRAATTGAAPAVEPWAVEEASSRTASAPDRAGIIDLGRLPDLSLQFLRRYRSVEVLEGLYAILMQMHEQYHILEVRDTPTIRVLDPPAVPLEKARPHRAVICAIATLLALAAGIAVAALLERIAMMAETDPEGHARLRRLLSGVGLGFLVR